MSTSESNIASPIRTDNQDACSAMHLYGAQSVGILVGTREKLGIRRSKSERMVPKICEHNHLALTHAHKAGCTNTLALSTTLPQFQSLLLMRTLSEVTGIFMSDAPTSFIDMVLPTLLVSLSVRLFGPEFSCTVNRRQEPMLISGTLS